MTDDEWGTFSPLITTPQCLSEEPIHVQPFDSDETDVEWSNGNQREILGDECGDRDDVDF